LNVGLLIYGSLDTLTGGYLYDRKMVEYLRNRGDRVRIFSLPWRNYARHVLDNASLKLAGALCSERLDVLVQDELNHPSLFWLNERIRAKVNYSMVALVHHLRCSELRPAWQNSFYRLVEKQYLSTVDGFVVNSLTTLSTVEELATGAKPSVVAYPGKDDIRCDISEEQIARRAEQSGPLEILFVGSLIRRKNLHALLAALARLPKDRWRLTVVGNLHTDPTYSRTVQRQIERDGIGRHVRLLGPLEKKDLVKRYAESHLLAVPSSYEGYGIVYVEGMGFGLPALACSVGAAPEIITHGVNGFLVQSDDVDSMTAHIDELDRDRDKLARMGVAAVERHAALPTWAESAAKIRTFLQEIIR
jgi:glycosyltransferase involved in cell wall biosynthesis